MTHLSYDESRPWAGPDASQAFRTIRLLRAAVIVGLAYYVGARIGFALTLKPSPVSTLWPPNSILLAAFLLTPVSSWWALLSGAFVAHLAVQLQSGIPIPMVLGWFLSNVSEALIGAGIIRHYIKGPLHLETFRQVSVFVVGASLIATGLSSLLDAGLVSLVGWGEGSYWNLWFNRTASNLLASLTLVPVIVTWANRPESIFRGVPLRRSIEAGILGIALVAVCLVVFDAPGVGATDNPALLYAPLPLLLLAAIRFGTRGISSCLLIVAAMAIWGAVNGQGPFATRSPAGNALSIQLFMAVVSIPLLTLAAVMREREQAESAARESQQHLSLALGASQVGTWEWWIKDDAGSISPKSRQILGLDDLDRVLTLGGFLNLVSPDDRAAVSDAIRAAVEEGSSYECEFRVEAADGTLRWVLSKGKVLYDASRRPERILGVNVDITDRKRAEETRREEAALRESEARFRELADAMPQIVWAARPDGQLDYFNRRWYELTGASAESTAGESWLSMTHPDDRQVTLEAWRTAVRTGESCEVEHRLRVEKTGEYRYHLARAVPVRDHSGAVLRWYGSCTDIEDQKQVERQLRSAGTLLEERVAERTAELSTAIVQLEEEIAERKAAERALRSSEERFGKAFRASPDAISIEARPNERIIEINDKWEMLFGFARDEAIGHSAVELGILEWQDHLQLRVLMAKQGHIHEQEVSLRNRAGGVLHGILTAERAQVAGELCTIVLIRDVTERKRAESMLMEQQRELAHLSRVASLGELSGALAHELNQPLAAILTNTRAAQRMMAMGSPDMAELREILEDIAFDDRRAGQVISRLHGLLKKGDRQMRPFKMEDIIAEVLGLLHSDLIQRRVSASTQLAPSLPPVRGDRVQLQQVLLNLILNACDAMADKPLENRRLTIATSLIADGSVQLSVSDQGTGVAETRLEKIFEPFVTTKENGLGLGLAICRSIVAAHGGRLWVVNNAEGGATFHMALSSAESPATESPVGVG